MIEVVKLSESHALEFRAGRIDHVGHGCSRKKDLNDGGPDQEQPFADRPGNERLTLKRVDLRIDVRVGLNRIENPLRAVPRLTAGAIAARPHLAAASITNQRSATACHEASAKEERGCERNEPTNVGFHWAETTLGAEEKSKHKTRVRSQSLATSALIKTCSSGP